MIKVDLNQFLAENAVPEQTEFVFGVENQNAIVNYLADMHGSNILSSFEKNEANTGVAMFFHCPIDCKDIVIVFRSKGFEESENGLFMIVYRNAHKASIESKNKIIAFFKDAFDGSNYLKEEVVKSFEGHVMKCIQVNV